MYTWIASIVGGLIDRYIMKAFRYIKGIFIMKQHDKKIDEDVDAQLSSVGFNLAKVRASRLAIELAGAAVTKELEDDLKLAEEGLRRANAKLSSNLFN